MKIVITLTNKENDMVKNLISSGLYSNRTELFRACIREIMVEFLRNGYIVNPEVGKE